MAKSNEVQVQAVQAIETVAEIQNQWQLAVNNPELPMADRIEAFKALAAEKRFAQDERRFQARSSILANDIERAEAVETAPMVYAALVEQEQGQVGEFRPVAARPVRARLQERGQGRRVGVIRAVRVYHSLGDQAQNAGYRRSGSDRLRQNPGLRRDVRRAALALEARVRADLRLPQFRRQA